MDQIPCPDGYLLESRSPIAAGHHALNQYLVRVEEAGWAVALKEVNAIRDQARKLVLWKALLERIAWLGANNPASQSWSAFRGLAERIEKWTLALTEADLVDLMERTAAVKAYVQPNTPIPHLMAYVEKNGLSRELSAAIERFRGQVYDKSYTPNQTSLQLLRSRLDMLAWRDEWKPIDLKRCWSEQVRSDFRRMTGPERENWRRILYSVDGDEGVRPAPRWLQQAQTLVAAIGIDEFNTRMAGWLASLRPGREQRLSREGSYLLRSFIWLIETSGDADLLAKAWSISQVQFKPKDIAGKVIRAAAEANGQSDSTPLPKFVPISSEALVSHALTAVFSPGNSLLPAKLAGRVESHDGIVYVRGDRDTYRLHVADGSIFRDSDGRPVTVSKSQKPEALPDFGGVTELLSQVLVLAEDAKHDGSLIATID